MSAPTMERRKYQEQCIAALRRAYRSAAIALYVLATGLGKTYVAIRFLGFILREEKRKLRILVLCHQNTILSQLEEEFRKHLGEKYTYGIRNSVAQAPKEQPDFLFASFQTMRIVRQQYGRKAFDIVLVDEGHHAAADSFSETITYFRARFRFAMTATPNRMDLRDIRKLFGTEVYSKPLLQALAEMLLPRIRYKVFLERECNLANVVDGVRPTKLLLNQRYFRVKSLAESKEIASKIAEHFRAIKEPRLLVFCNSVDHTGEMATVLQAEGINAVAVHSKIASGINEANIRAFKAGKLDALVAVDVLNEGKDMPAVNLVATVRCTDSVTIFEQQIGRGLRPGKPELVFLDFVANCDRIAMVLDYSEQVEAMRAALAPHGEQPPSAPMIDIVSGRPDLAEEFRDIRAILEKIAQSWNRDSSIAALKLLAVDGRLAIRKVKDGSKRGICPAVGTLVSLFGSMQEAAEAAGLEYGSEDYTRDDQKALEALRVYAKSIQKVSLNETDIKAGSVADLCPSPSFLRKRFGSYTNALKLAGLKSSGLEKRLSRSAAIKQLQAYAATLGGRPMTTALIEEGSNAGRCPSTTTFVNYFGSVTAGIKAANLKGANRHSWTKDSAIAAMKKYAGKRTDQIPELEWAKAANEGKLPGRLALYRLFGSVADAKQAAGLKAKVRK